MTSKYDMVVIGAGPAGEKGAAQAAYFGKRVAIVDPRPRLGGIAVTSAGIPTKTSPTAASYTRKRCWSRSADVRRSRGSDSRKREWSSTTPAGSAFNDRYETTVPGYSPPEM
jgi:pyruvate/2-oxoglutarate dehydrogenase complex dihydrolipoamide dehydrogenase (E3) component